MKTMEYIYDNKLGASYRVEKIIDDENVIALEINQISFLINHRELKQFVRSSEEILNHYADCTCSPDLENKTVIYKAKQTEIRMKLSYNMLHQLKDLLKGTEFRLSMNHLLKKYKIS